eukprot:TRINITY_DN18569_c0_g1_i1.p2 TRINITY_DN18569_c0_g1~~TRINITY_DN18569_c0_g1_i1.p2  ORF type:complete len:118 (+),score=33.98 TRINITY_DN18569_c0_g1_i1:23-376(+)
MGKKTLTPVTREYTINLHKRVHGITFRTRAPRAMRAIKKFAQDAMKTQDVRVANEVNKFVWSKGIKRLPHRVRVRIERKYNQNDDDEENETMYSLVTLVPLGPREFKGKLNTTVTEE